MDALSGQDGNDTLDGGTEADFVSGGAGNDSLLGGSDSSNDNIDGGLGQDTMTGGLGNDLFIYNSQADSTMLAYDHITDFTPDGLGTGDRIYMPLVPTLAGDAGGGDFYNAGALGVASGDAGLEAAINAAVTALGGWGSAADVDVDFSVVTTTDSKTFVVIDINDSGTFTAADDIVIDVTGGSVGSFGDADIIVT